MKALLLVAHGSRRSLSNDEVVLLAKKLQSHCSEHYPIIHAAFLELAEPLIPDGIKLCIDNGAKSITVLPYFLNSGRHVTEDIPAIVKQAQKIYSHIPIHIAPHLGASEHMLDLLVSSANNAIAN